MMRQQRLERVHMLNGLAISVQVFVSCPVLPQAEAPASSSAASILSFPAIAEASEVRVGMSACVLF